MTDSKYGKFLTILLVIVIIAIVALLGYLGYDYYQKYFITKDTGEFLSQFDGEVEATNQTNNIGGSAENPLNQLNEAVTGGSSTSGKTWTYKGFNVLGKIEIPKTNLKYPILDKVTKKSIETSVAVQYTTAGLNEPGNTLIVGHNYRNGLFFSNNKKIEIGDSIFIKDNSGRTITYKVYNKYETEPSDSDYITRDTKGAREISLSTCTDNSKARLVIWAKEE